VSPSAEPLYATSVDLYGIASGNGTAEYGDAFSGTYLGTFPIPPDLWFGQTASFDVTAFVANAHVPYLGFNFRDAGSAFFYAPQLNVTFVPEPTTATLLLLGMLGCGWRRRSL